ncbi:MAG: type II toxin-antitoxin system HicA family toxin [Treponema sp.]|nr:type II toxin-antitoxin system HicA family toxin [Treponema sp.]
MSKKDKLISRLKSNPKNFTFDETKSLLGVFGYTLTNKGKTSGSRVCFVKNNKVFRMHKPHSRKELLTYQVKELIDELEQEGLL